MNIIEIIAQDVFDKIRGRFSNLEMGDQDGGITKNPRDARFFDFDFAIEGHTLGRVSVSINELGSLKVFYSKGITEDVDRITLNLWYEFLKEMRYFAKRRMLRFDTRDIAKGNLDKNDFQYLAQNGTKETNMNESSMYGSSKTSYRKLENTKLIIRHSKKVEEGKPGARSRHIESLFVENSDGERFKYPFVHLAGARAMQRHVANGGRPYDELGREIINMSENIAKLVAFERHVGHHDGMNAQVNEILERSHMKLQQLRKTVEAMSRQGFYEQYRESYNPQMDDGFELDQATMEDYKSKFTVHNFKEDLAQYFPLIHKIMQETGTVELEEYVSESDNSNYITLDGKTVDLSSLEVDGVHHWDYPDFTDAYLSYGQFTDGTELSDEQLEKLQDEHSDLASNLAHDSMFESGTNEFNQFEAWANMVSEGALEPDVKEELHGLLSSGLMYGVDGDTAIQSVQGVGINDKNLEAALKINSTDPNADASTTILSWLDKVHPESAAEFAQYVQPQNDTATEPATSEPMPQEPAMAESEEDMVNAEPERQAPSMKEIAEVVKSFYDKETGKFPRGETGVVTHCKKMFGERGGALAERLVAHLSSQAEAIDPNNPRDYEIPAYQRKAQGQAPLTPKDVQDKDNASPTTSAGLAKRKAELGVDEDTDESMSRHAKGWKKYGPGMKELAKAGKAGASEEEMDRIRDKYDRYDEAMEEMARIRELAGFKK